MPADGNAPFPLGSCHGKTLMTALRVKLHHQARGSIQAVDALIHADSPHLVSPKWQKAFA